MAEQAGIRALLAHPIDEDAARFYLRFGFVVSPLHQLLKRFPRYTSKGHKLRFFAGHEHQ